MPLPSFTITGTLFDLLGNVAAGEIVGNGLGGATPATVTFTSNVPQGYFVTFGGVAYRVDEVTATVNSDGTITRNGDPVQLLANDAGLSIEGLQWQCHVNGMHRFWFNAPVDGGTVNLGTVAPVPGIGVGGVTFSAGELITLLADSASPIRVALDALYVGIGTGAMRYKGVWNATTNSPTLADGTGHTGDFYHVSPGGTQNLGSGAITFTAGDYALYNGTTWEKADTTDAVASVFGRTGAITGTPSDVAPSSSAAITANTAPTRDQITIYDATSGALAVALPALSGLTSGWVYPVQRYQLDVSTNAITFTPNGADTFDSGSTTFSLPLSGELRYLQVVTVASVKKWKVVNGNTPLGSLDKRYIAKSTVVNVKDYGALGDNSTDDSAAFTAALNAAKNATLTGNTATVFVPSGFYVTGPLTLANRVAIRGERGVGTSRLRLKSGSTAPLITNETNARMIGVYDLYLDGGKFNGVSSANAHGIVLDNSAALNTDVTNGISEWVDGRSVVSNVFIQYCKGSGIKTLGRALCRVNDVQMFLCDGHGVDVGGVDSEFANLNVGASGKDGFYLHAGGNNRFTNCYAWYSGAVDTDGGLTNGTGHGFHVDTAGGSPNVYSSCVAQDNMRAGFYLDNSSRQIFAACSADSNNRGNLGHCGVEINGSGANSWDGISQDRGVNTFHQVAGVRLIGSTIDNKVSAVVPLSNMSQGALSTDSVIISNTVLLSDGVARKHSFAGAIAYRLFSDGGASLTLTTGATVWEFTGTTATWTLPTRTGNTGVPLIIQNRGSGVLTVQRASSEQIYTDSAVTSVTVSPGQTLKLISDGTYWVAFRPSVAGRLATAHTINGVAFDGTADIITRPIVQVATSVTLAAVANEYLVRIQAGGTPTLPTAVGNTSTYILINEDTADHNVLTTSSQTIGGFASPFVLPPGQSIKVYSDNANWRQF